MDLVQTSLLPNGIRVVTEVMPQVRTASLGLWVATGSRYESAAVHGISHFLEHLFFKGTHRQSALQIAQAVDAVGGQMNAFTEKEHTWFYVKVLANHLPAMVELMADMLLNSALDPEAIERERQVITEEIKTYEDSPDELVQDLICQTIWNGHPLGRSVIGTRRTVSSLSRADFLQYMEQRYRPDNIVISVAGDIEHGAVMEMLARHLADWNGRAAPQPTEAPPLSPSVTLRPKDVEQVHVCLATRGRPQADDSLYVLEVLDNVLGSGMSSRLFYEIREKRGLVYTIGSYTPSYREGGLFVIYAAMSPEAGPEVLELTFDEIAGLPQTLRDDEVARAKESLKGNVMLSLEGTTSRMTKLARSELYYGRQITLDEILQKIDAVTLDDVRRMAAGIFTADQPAMAAIGPFSTQPALGTQLERTFTEGLGRLSARAAQVASTVG
ncbi:MAG: insulinase family protein [Armatimonadetes bacterium]|nr:insulinase family protein [Armatimonadota bacterium]